MGWVLASRLPKVPVQELETLGLLVVLALTVVSVGTYALVARCLRDAQPEDRWPTSWAVSATARPSRTTRRLVRYVGGYDEGRRPVRCDWRPTGNWWSGASARLP